jgi:hypothetical protein
VWSVRRLKAGQVRLELCLLIAALLRHPHLRSVTGLEVLVFGRFGGCAHRGGHAAGETPTAPGAAVWVSLVVVVVGGAWVSTRRRGDEGDGLALSDPTSSR